MFEVKSENQKENPDEQIKTKRNEQLYKTESRAGAREYNPKNKRLLIIILFTD